MPPWPRSRSISKSPSFFPVRSRSFDVAQEPVSLAVDWAEGSDWVMGHRCAEFGKRSGTEQFRRRTQARGADRVAEPEAFEHRSARVPAGTGEPASWLRSVTGQDLQCIKLFPPTQRETGAIRNSCSRR